MDEITRSLSFLLPLPKPTPLLFVKLHMFDTRQAGFFHAIICFLQSKAVFNAISETAGSPSSINAVK